MATNGKDVIYVDVDDEITGIIDKVSNSQSKIVALVLPKRATVFQSIVNMKLLKKRADTAKKQPVLITSETALLPMAGSVGLYVAKTLQSKPEIPSSHAAATAAAAAGAAGIAIHRDGEDEESENEFDAQEAADKPVGDLAGESDSVNSIDDTPEDTIELDNSDTPSKDAGKDVAAVAAAGAAGKSGAKAKKGKNKHLKVPNFNKFRMKLALIILGVILLIVGWIVANNVLPKAEVTVTTDTSNVNSNLTPTLDTTATTVDVDKQIVPAKVVTITKNYTGQASASGKKNNGDKATGSVSLTTQACAPNLGTPDDLPAGSGMSANGLTFISSENAKFHFAGFSGGSCANYNSDNVSVTAENGGTNYNLGAGTTFTVAGRSNISGSGQTDGGTDQIVTVIQQSDIDSAKKQAEQGVDKNALKSQLQQQLQDQGQYAITDTFVIQKPQVSVSAKAGDQVSTVAYTENATYTMFGAQKSDLDKLIEASVKDQIDTSKQSIQDDGLNNAQVAMPNPGTTTKVQVEMQVTTVIGPHIDENELKKSIAGSKAGEARSVIKGYPGVNDVSVHLSPFWVETVPKNPDKIVIVYKKSTNGN